MNEQSSQRIIEICKRMYDRGYILTRSGNVSCKLDDGRVLITPSRVRKHSLNANDLCIIDLEGHCDRSDIKPSSEYRVHCMSYKNRPDVKTIIHAHAPYAIICSLATISFEYPILPETALTLGSIPTIPYMPPGTDELAEAMKNYLKDHNAFILERHGVVAFGEDLEDAFDRIEEVEHTAKIAYSLSIKGRIPVMGRSQLLKIVNFAKNQGFPVPEIAMKLLHRILAK